MGFGSSFQHGVFDGVAPQTPQERSVFPCSRAFACAFQCPLRVCAPCSKQVYSTEGVCTIQERHFPLRMLRVQKKRRPDDWEKKNSKLSGRFLPMDPRDEAIFDLFENDNKRPEVESEYGPEGPPSQAYGEYAPGRLKKWSKRSEAARKRWADPSYRAKMLEKRAAKKRMKEEANGVPKHKVEIGRMDSITLCDDDKAKAINDYARSNKLRSEKISAFHHNRKLWMETRLSKGQPKLTEEEYVEKKKEVQQRRREIALKRAREKRARRANGAWSVDREVT